MNVKEGNIRGVAVDAPSIAVNTVDSCIAVVESVVEGDISGVLINSAGVGQVSNRLGDAAVNAAQVVDDIIDE